MGIQIRVAKSEDADSIFQMVLDLLECSKMKAEEITITAQDFKENAFGERKSFDIFVAEERTAEGRKHLVGLLTYSLLYNCIKGRSLHMEVLYVSPAYRSRGIGRLLMQALAKVAVQDRCVAIDWECLGWNSGVCHSGIRDLKKIRKMGIQIRVAKSEDADSIFQMVLDLLECSKMKAEEITITAQDFKENAFGERKSFDIFVAEERTAEGRKHLVGLLTYSLLYNCIKGRSLHMEVLYVSPAYRSRGIGRLLMQALAKVAVQDRCVAIDWECLGWNSGVCHSGIRDLKKIRKMGIQIRVAKSEDADSIFQMVLDLLECSKMKAEEITITAQDFKENAFGERKSFDIFVAEETTAEGRKQLVGLVTYSLFYNCINGRSLHMEVLYVSPAYRSRGIGRLLMQALAKAAMQERCVAIDWECLGWNSGVLFPFADGPNHLILFWADRQVRRLSPSLTKAKLFIAHHDITLRVETDCRSVKIPFGNSKKLTRQMGIQIRVAQLEDADSIFQMFLDLLEELKKKVEEITITPEGLKENSFGERKTFDTFVAEETTDEGNKHLVGLLTYNFLYHYMKGRSIHMEVLYVAPEYRRKGVGKQLMQAMTKVAVRDRCAAIFWECYAWNSAAMTFYKRGGAIDTTADNQAHFMMLQERHIKKSAK